MDSTTTTRVTVEDRDRINELARELGIAAPKVLTYLLDEDWKRKVIEDWDRLREEDPQAWRESLAEGDAWDVTLHDGMAGDAFWAQTDEDKDAA